MVRNKKRLLSLVLAFLLLLTALPMQVFAEDNEITITFTDGTKTVTEETEIGYTFEIPKDFKPPAGQFIIAIKDADGKERNPMEILRKNEVFTIEYGDKIETTFSIVGNKNFNGDQGYGDQIAPPRKVEITYQDLQGQKEKYDIGNDRYAVVANVVIKAMESDPKLSGELTEDLISQIQTNYISKAFGLGEFVSGPMSGWMYFINHYYSNLGLGEAGAYNTDYIRWYNVDNFMVNNYTFFDELTKEVEVNQPIKVHLLYRNRQGDALDYEGATLIVDDEEYKVNGEFVKTDGNGEASVVFNQPGNHYISARHMIEDSPDLHKITMPYMAVTVKEASKPAASIPDEWIQSKADAIANEYDKMDNLNDWWKIIELAKYHQVKGDFSENTINQNSLDYLKNVTIDAETGKVKTDINTLTKSVLAVRAAGYDPEDYYGNNLVELLAKAPMVRNSAYEYGPALNALSSDDYRNSPSVNQAINTYIDKLLASRNEEGLWVEFNLLDATGFALYGLAPYYNDTTRPEVKEAVDKAIEAMGKKLLDNADFNGDPGNSNSLSMPLGGLVSMDPNLAAKPELTRGNKTMFHALKDYEIGYGFKWMKTERNPNDMATEQGFRTLVTYLSMKQGNGYVFDFRGVPKKVLKAPVDKTALKETIKKATELAKADVTSTDGSDVPKDKTWVTPEVKSALETALENANTIKEKTDATQEEVTEATNALTTAMENYKPQAGTKPAPVNKTDLNNAITTAENKMKDVVVSSDGMNVEPEKTWVTQDADTAFKQAIADAKAVSNKSDATQEEVTEATNALTTAMENYKPQAGTKPAPVNKTALEAAIKKVDELTKADVTSADGKDVDQDKTWVTPEIEIALTNALKSAKDVVVKADATQEQVNSATTALTTATQNYKPAFGTKEEVVIPTVDKTALEAAIKEANALSKADATSADGTDVPKDKTWVTEVIQKALDEALTTAQTVAADTNATQEEVNSATTALSAAIRDYKPVTGTKEPDPTAPVLNKTALEREIARANALPRADYISQDGKNVEPNKTWVTAAIKTALDQAVTQAKSLVENKDATQEDINTATAALQQAIDSYKPQYGTKVPVVKPVNKGALQEAIHTAKANIVAISKDGRDIDKNKQWTTEDDRLALENAIQYGESIFRKADADQETVNIATAHLTHAIKSYINGKHYGTKMEYPRWNDGYVPAFRPTITRPNPVKPETKSEVKPDVQPQPIPHFIDTPGHWAEDVINYVVEKGYFKGTGPDTFSPNRSSTRAELITVLGRIAGINPNDYKTSALPDIQSGTFYDGYANWAVSVGIIKGNERGEFEPNREITREEVAAILARYFAYIGKNKPASGQHTYNDQNDISPWARDAVNQLTEAGILKGQGQNTFAPQKDITRAEIAQLIYNMETTNLLK